MKPKTKPRGIWDERSKTFIEPSGTVKQGRRPMFQAPKGAPTWGNDGQDEARAQAFIEGKNFVVAHAQRLADALERLECDIDCYDGMKAEKWESVTQAREALAEGSAA